MGCMLDQLTEPDQKERVIYYLSKKFTSCEINYIAIEKTCCALAWASRKPQQYMLYYTTRLISRMDPIKYIFEKPALIGKICHWQMLLSEFDIVFMTRKVIKGQAIADYLADQLLNDPELSKSLFLNEDVMALELEPNSVEPWRWKLYFDGAANSIGSGVGAVLVFPKGQQIPVSVMLNFDSTNNVTEYEACIVGRQVALEFSTYDLRVFRDSLLIISQIKGKWQAQDTKLILYQKCVNCLIPKF
ncbi:uncharacterized protein LOC126712529 [Quercus robur]|uniref:uncharacterized protein LOC126712529 n=1 Tax=Quercus robur TaxID=38942 RepID=UPI0021634309|nr:uncharacterized protein LOC126712529 [Quercus robur]